MPISPNSCPNSMAMDLSNVLRYLQILQNQTGGSVPLHVILHNATLNMTPATPPQTHQLSEVFRSDALFYTFSVLYALVFVFSLLGKDATFGMYSLRYMSLIMYYIRDMSSSVTIRYVLGYIVLCIVLYRYVHTYDIGGAVFSATEETALSMCLLY